MQARHSATIEAGSITVIGGTLHTQPKRRHRVMLQRRPPVMISLMALGHTFLRRRHIIGVHAQDRHADAGSFQIQQRCSKMNQGSVGSICSALVVNRTINQQRDQACTCSRCSSFTSRLTKWLLPAEVGTTGQLVQLFDSQCGKNMLHSAVRLLNQNCP